MRMSVASGGHESVEKPAWGKAVSKVKLRLQGFTLGVEAIAAVFALHLRVLKESANYQNCRSQYVRRYLAVRQQNGGVK